MQISCTNCGMTANAFQATNMITQAWCVHCQQPRSFLPALNTLPPDEADKPYQGSKIGFTKD